MEKYTLKILPEGGQKSLEILDKVFNDQTKYFLSKHLSAGMNILDIGCGLGAMTQYLAEKVGPSGMVTAIDNNMDQLKAAIGLYQGDRIKWLNLDIYDLDKIGNKFDLIYCRFVLHHIHRPLEALEQIAKCLQDDGIYIGIEGIVNYAFSIPEQQCWDTPRWPVEVNEGENRNGNIGKVLPNLINKSNMNCISSEIFQPVLIEPSIRQLLLQELIDTRSDKIASGELTSNEWDHKYNTFKSCLDDPSVTIGFYAGNFVAAKKSKR